MTHFNLNYPEKVDEPEAFIYTPYAKVFISNEAERMEFQRKMKDWAHGDRKSVKVSVCPGGL